MLFKNTLRQIKRSLGRYLAIFAIVALGVGFFVGLRVSKDAMVKTGGNYFEELKLFDFRLVSTLGLTDEDVKAIEALSEVKTAVGSVSADLMFTQKNGSNGVLHMHTLLSDINRLDLVSGRLPESPDECVIDSKYYSDGILNTYIELSKDNSQSTFDTFAYDRYKIVGVASSPYYANFERGSSSLGGVSGFAYILPEGFTSDYYTEIFVKLQKTYDIYSQEADDYSSLVEKELSKALEERGQIRYEQILSDAKEEIQKAEEELADGRKDFEIEKADALQQIADGENEIANADQKLQDAKLSLAEAKLKLDEGETQLSMGYSQLDLAIKQYEINKKHMTVQMQEATEQELAKNKEDLDGQKAYLEAQKQEYDTAYSEYETSLASLDQARKELETRKKEAEEEFAKAEAKLQEGQDQIDEAYEKLKEVKEASSFVLGRSTNVGYSSLKNDTEIVAGVSKVFPLFFFIVASLVCITTMTRMVDEQRVQNGTLKALGYSDTAIAVQYLFYAGSASIAGCILGFLLGSKFMPLILWKVYHIMYSIDRPIVYLLDWKLFGFSAALYLLATLGTTWLAVSSDLREAAAELIRPKAPTAGKRVFLEKIGFLWKRIKFLHKVSIRNILRYKKRMFMMIIGVGGCTALLLTGYGIRDSIQPILDYQFHEIHLYDMVVSFLEPQDQKAREDFLKEHASEADQIAFVYMGNMDLLTNGSSDSVYLVAADSLDQSLVNLHNGKETYSWPGKNETIIDYRLAKDNNISIGDTIEFRDSDYHVLTLKVVGIFDNYLRDYAYISQETYETQMGKNMDYNTAYVNVPEGADAKTVSSDFLKDSSVTSVSVTDSQIEMVGNMLSSLDYIVLIVLVCAGALAFIVIYNLTNISINERIREIATIKVLGFYEREAAAYVFRENLVLSLISSLVGLPMGVALHRYVMAQIRIKSMYFGHRILWQSFVYAVVITLIFAIIVDIFMYFRLKKINMAESLKAID